MCKIKIDELKYVKQKSSMKMIIEPLKMNLTKIK